MGEFRGSYVQVSVIFHMFFARAKYDGLGCAERLVIRGKEGFSYDIGCLYRYLVGLGGRQGIHTARKLNVGIRFLDVNLFVQRLSNELNATEHLGFEVALDDQSRG